MQLIKNIVESAKMTTVMQRTGLGSDSAVNPVQVGPVNGQQMPDDNGSDQVQEQPQVSETKTMDVAINNVVCSFSTKCHLNLKRIAMEGSNVEYHREHGMLNMRLRHPKSTASIWSSGKITCTGATSEDFARMAARRFARKLQKLGNKVKFSNYRVVNVLGTCSLPFSINIVDFSKNRKEASYEPELHPGVTYKITEPKATLKIFSTGSITITAPRVSNVLAAVEHIYPLVEQYNAGPPRLSASNDKLNSAKRRRVDNQAAHFHHHRVYDEEDEDSFDSDEEDYDSDESD